MDQPTADQPTADQPTADQSTGRLRRVPLALVVCGLLFSLWAVRLPDPVGVVCTRTAPGDVTCVATLPVPWAWLPAGQHAFALQGTSLASNLCDNNPQGGVRFCHRLTLLGPDRRVTLPAIRTPLSGAALTEQIDRFVAGDGSPQLMWSSAAQRWPRRSLVIGLLLAIATWGLWNWRWPPLPTAEDRVYR